MIYIGYGHPVLQKNKVINMKKIPLRTCVGCKEVKSKKELIRVVKQADGKMMVDFTGKANGRGAYLCPVEGCLEQAIKTKRLSREFECEIPKEVYDELRSQIMKGNNDE
jgi:predicted RNA-binding protein YlxR (DUF448 family)